MNLIRPCSVCAEREIVYVAKQLCRTCNDKIRGKEKWERIKADPIALRKFNDRMSFNARERRKDNPEAAAKDRAACRAWYANNKEYRKEYWSGYYGKTREYHLNRSRERRFDGLYMRVIERDGYSCKRCAMRLELGRRLNVHHIDRDKSNNTLENLITVCTKCHQGHYHADKYIRHKELFPPK